MGDSTRKIDVQKLLAFGDDLVGCLKEEKDVKNLTQHMELSKALQSHCNGDSKAVRNLLQDYRKKIDLSKKKADEAKSEAVADAEMDSLQKEFDGELQREHLLMEELTQVYGLFHFNAIVPGFMTMEVIG